MGSYSCEVSKIIKLTEIKSWVESGGVLQKWKEELSNRYKATVTKINNDHLNTILKILD